MASAVLRAQLASDELMLLRETFTPYDLMGEWPVWAYIDQMREKPALPRFAGSIARILAGTSH